MNIYNDRTKAKEEALNIIKKVDINMSGEIDFFEFIIAATDQKQALSKDKIAQAFHTFDIVTLLYLNTHNLQDGDGFITEIELKQVMGGIEIDEMMWKDILDDCDDNNDGKVCFIR